MDPNTGRIFPSLDAARLAGIEEPVEISGTPEQVERISSAVRSLHNKEKKRAKNKAARAARKASR